MADDRYKTALTRDAEEFVDRWIEKIEYPTEYRVGATKDLVRLLEKHQGLGKDAHRELSYRLDNGFREKPVRENRTDEK